MCAWAFLCPVDCGLGLVDSGRPQGAGRPFRLLDALGRSVNQKTSLNKKKSKNNVSHFGKASLLFLFGV